LFLLDNEELIEVKILEKEKKSFKMFSSNVWTIDNGTAAQTKKSESRKSGND
jgi:hypothetical protein